MPDLETLIREWRKVGSTPHVSPETLDELETHLRETAEHFVRSGMPVADAFQHAVAELGPMAGISSEFQKLDQPLWLPIKLTIGVTALTAVAAFIIAIALLGRSNLGVATLLLAIHVFVITLGYTIPLLIGGLGICFVSQRCFGDFTTSRLQSISRVSFVLSALALLLTTLGVVLGMLWAKISWGRYWGWDVKEIGASCVVVWEVIYLLAHRFSKNSPRGVLTISMFGNIVVSFAWFGPHLSGAVQYGTFNSSMLIAVVVANLGFCALGYAPAGCLRSRQA